jgi:hypothetical protein
LFEIVALANISEGCPVTDAELASVHCLPKPLVDADDNDAALDEDHVHALMNSMSKDMIIPTMASRIHRRMSFT